MLGNLNFTTEIEAVKKSRLENLRSSAGCFLNLSKNVKNLLSIIFVEFHSFWHCLMYTFLEHKTSSEQVERLQLCQAMLGEHWKARCKWFETETWDLRERDFQKQVSGHISRKRPDIEAPSLLVDFLVYFHGPQDTASLVNAALADYANRRSRLDRGDGRLRLWPAVTVCVV